MLTTLTLIALRKPSKRYWITLLSSMLLICSDQAAECTFALCINHYYIFSSYANFLLWALTLPLIIL